MQISNENSARDAYILQIRLTYLELESNIALNYNLDIKYYFFKWAE